VRSVSSSREGLGSESRVAISEAGPESSGTSRVNQMNCTSFARPVNWLPCPCCSRRARPGSRGARWGEPERHRRVQRAGTGRERHGHRKSHGWPHGVSEAEVHRVAALGATDVHCPGEDARERLACRRPVLGGRDPDEIGPDPGTRTVHLVRRVRDGDPLTSQLRGLRHC
jgi:hypothetical protein